MKSVPPRAIEIVVGFLIPPACREEVLGDLHERCIGPRQYIVDALRAVPLVIVSRIRRTTDAAVLLTEAIALYLSFLLAAWVIDRAFLTGPEGLWLLALPVAVALWILVLRDAYAAPGKRLPWEPVLRPVAGLGCALLLRNALAIGRSELALPASIMLWGCGVGVLLVSTLRMLFPPVTDMPQGASGPPFWQHYVSLRISPEVLSIVSFVAMIVAAALVILYRHHRGS
jgi:hypothetical protein